MADSQTTSHAWLLSSRIVTRNSDGGTTGWAEHDAVMLHHQLGVLLTELADAREACANGK